MSSYATGVPCSAGSAVMSSFEPLLAACNMVPLGKSSKHQRCTTLGFCTEGYAGESASALRFPKGNLGY
jgi:hypothetical protein